jgi:hypothetical protein
VGVTDLYEYPGDVGEKVFAALHGHTKHLVELGQRNDDGSRIGEADDDRMRQQVDDGPHAQQAQCELDDANQERQQDGENDITLGTGCRQRRQAGSRQQGYDRDRSGG